MKDLKNKKIFKDFPSVETKEAGGEPRTLVVKISTPSPDRSDDTVQPKGGDFDNFLKNPVVLYAHDYSSIPIAKCTSLKASDDGIMATVKFPDEGTYGIADTVYQMYKQGFLNAWSIGFMPKEDGYEENAVGGMNFTKWELFEFSAVPVPANPEALTVMRSKGINIDVLFEKGVIGYKKTPLAPKDEKWDAGEEVKAASVEDLKAMCTWFDSENSDNKGAYKLPHHKAEGDHACVWAGVKAACAAIDGARGGTDIPDSDMSGVKAHLEKHCHDFGEKAPWENDDGKSFEDAKTKAVSDNGSYSADMTIGELTVAQFTDLLQNVFDLPDDDSKDNWTDPDDGDGEKGIAGITVKSGRTISAKHEKMLNEATNHMQNAMDNVKSVLGSVQSTDEDEEDSAEEEEEKNVSIDTLKGLQRAFREQDRSIGKTLRTLKLALDVEGGDK